MSNNFNFKKKNDDRVYSAVMNPFYGKYMILQTNETISIEDMNNAINEGKYELIK